MSQKNQNSNQPRRSVESDVGLKRRESLNSHSNTVAEGDEPQTGGQSTKNKNQMNSSSSSSSANAHKQPKQKHSVGAGGNSLGHQHASVSPVFLTSQQTTSGNNNNSASNLNSNAYAQGTGRHVDQFPKIGEAYGQLNNLVEVLEEKVEGVIERHEAEFLVAYKNQMQKIRKELQEMKNNMDEQEKKLKAGDQLDELEKQLAWFRDESLKLYSKLASKDKQIADFKQIVLDQKKELSFHENQITALKKKIRVLAKKASVNSGAIESEHSSNLNSYSQLQNTSMNRSTIKQNNSSNHAIDNGYTPQMNNLNLKSGSVQNKRPVSVDHMNKNSQGILHSGANAWNNSNFNYSGQNFHMASAQQYNLLNDVAEQNETQGSLQPIEESSRTGNQVSYSQYVQPIQHFEGWMPQSEFIAEMIAKYSESDPIRLVKELTQMFRVEEEKRNKQTKVLKERLDRVMKEKLTQNVVRSDLENFFLECIETVRKQIIKRKPGGLARSKNDTQLNFYLNQIKDYSVFRTEDKIKIIELLLSNERLIMFLYQKIFPQNYAKLIHNNVGIEGNSMSLAEATLNLEQNSTSKARDNSKDSNLNLETEEMAKLIENIGFPEFITPKEESRHHGFEGMAKTTAGVASRQNRVTRPLTSQNPSLRQHNNFSLEGSFQQGSVNPQTTRQFAVESYELQKPNLTKQKIASLINSDFSQIPRRSSFKNSKAAYKAY